MTRKPQRAISFLFSVLFVSPRQEWIPAVLHGSTRPVDFSQERLLVRPFGDDNATGARISQGRGGIRRQTEVFEGEERSANSAAPRVRAGRRRSGANSAAPRRAASPSAFRAASGRRSTLRGVGGPGLDLKAGRASEAAGSGLRSRPATWRRWAPGLTPRGGRPRASPRLDAHVGETCGGDGVGGSATTAKTGRARPASNRPRRDGVGARDDQGVEGSGRGRRRCARWSAPARRRARAERPETRGGAFGVGSRARDEHPHGLGAEETGHAARQSCGLASDPFRVRARPSLASPALRSVRAKHEASERQRFAVQARMPGDRGAA